MPATPSTPVFEKGNSFKGGASLGVDGLSANLDYSPFNHFYLGGNSHGYYARYNQHLNAGGHAGVYFNLHDSLLHLNFQAGYVAGNSLWSDTYVGSDYTLGGAFTIYHTKYLQAFCAMHPGKRKQFGAGLRYDLYDARYPWVDPVVFAPHVPNKGGIPMGFVFWNIGFKKHPAFQFNFLMAINVMLVKQYPGAGTYAPYFMRAGISYQVHFGKK